MNCKGLGRGQSDAAYRPIPVFDLFGRGTLRNDQVIPNDVGRGSGGNGSRILTLGRGQTITLISRLRCVRGWGLGALVPV
jgi:hypothetical protein